MGTTYMTVREARDYLGVSEYKITEILKRKNIAKVPGQRDRRTELVPRAAIEALAREWANEPVGAVRRFKHASRP